MQSTSSRLDMPLGEAMFTQRSIRKFKSDPIADEDIRTMLEAAAKAPNGGNRQPGRFLVLTDRGTILQFGALYREAWWAKRRDEGQPWTSLEEIPPEQGSRRAAAPLAAGITGPPASVRAFTTGQGPVS